VAHSAAQLRRFTKAPGEAGLDTYAAIKPSIFPNLYVASIAVGHRHIGGERYLSARFPVLYIQTITLPKQGWGRIVSQSWLSDVSVKYQVEVISIG
jgi:hypothetical protein